MALLTVGSRTPVLHFVPKRRSTVTDRPRYRITRGGFDVVSVFGSLGAEAVPGPVVTAVLELHGYTESAARNQITRLVQLGMLERS